VDVELLLVCTMSVTMVASIYLELGRCPVSLKNTTIRATPADTAYQHLVWISQISSRKLQEPVPFRDVVAQISDSKKKLHRPVTPCLSVLTVYEVLENT
jgi:hypothetical protein